MAANLPPDDPPPPSRSPEETRAIILKAQEAMQGLGIYLSDEKLDPEVVLVALQMLIAHVSLQMGVSFQEMMASLAQNMPVFYRKWVEAKAKEVGEPSIVLVLDDFRKGR